jgi:hypothetical protein
LCLTDDGYFPSVVYDARTGVYSMICGDPDQYDDDHDSTLWSVDADAAENAMCGTGKIYKYVGVIESV